MAYLLHQLLTESAVSRPDAEAVRLLDQALTYGELDRLSNQIANALIANGVVPGDRVGIYLHKSPSAIAGIFGIMKTGACYVPVDANAPGMRLEEIGRQCAFSALITSHVLYQKLGASFHQECSMNAIFFVDQVPESEFPLPAFSFSESPAFVSLPTTRQWLSSITTSPTSSSPRVPLALLKESCSLISTLSLL